MDGLTSVLPGLAVFLALTTSAGELRLTDDDPLQLAPVGACQLRVLAPDLLELTLITTKAADQPRVQQWDFVATNGQYRLPAMREFAVSANGKSIAIKAVGFRRRVTYAPLKQRDLRIGNYLYLELSAPLAENACVEVKNPSHQLWAASLPFVATNAPFRWSPVLHVNQTGYLPAYPKKAMVGYYLGTLGEMDLEHLVASTNTPTTTTPSSPTNDTAQANPVPELRPISATALSNTPHASRITFSLLDAHSHKPVFQGLLAPRPDQGFPFECDQHVLEADFSAFKTPGEYCLFVPGLGTSFPFLIDDAVAGAFARTYALGIYHQRCGTSNALPFTRFTHGPCHTAPAEVPDMTAKFAAVNEALSKESADYKDNPRHTAPQLKNVDASLYPFVNRGPVDVHGGHHDAGDYSKYTINSASFIHELVFAADVFPGAASLDNLGLPESGDGKSDLLQEAKWEADFLARMQDADGGFYFLVYPRDREYEINVLPDHGDPQVVFPKTTAVTAAAVAALAQCASSPTFKKQFPDAAALYLERAKKGWAFLERALAKYGKDGAYQKITHYGDYFMHDDELAWAACELYLATGEPAYHKQLLDWFNPADPATRRWGWLRLFDSYGNAIRSYAFAAKTGRLKRDQFDPFFLDACENEIAAAGEEQLRAADNSAYGTSFREATKHSMSAGWYFSGDAAFDLAVAYQLDYPIKRDPRPQLLAALISNLNYEQGCNPVNVTYLTGLGSKRQREIVDQYAQNDRRVLPPSGIPLGNLQSGFGYNWIYHQELDLLSYPPDGESAKSAVPGQPNVGPYPFYDRWGDGWNLSQEFVILNQARALGYLAWLMAQTPLKTQPWKSAPAEIVSAPSAPRSTPHAQRFTLSAPGLDLSHARILWEAAGQEPALGQSYTVTPAPTGPQWVEAEAQLPDGRRVFAVKELGAR
jgi:hypothetical protein